MGRLSAIIYLIVKGTFVEVSTYIEYLMQPQGSDEI